MKYATHFAILVVCSLGLAGCLGASNKQVRFTCDDSVVAGDLEKQITVIAQAHQFRPAPPQKGGLSFYSDMEFSPSLYAVVSPSHPPEFILGITVTRVPGSEDKLPPKVLTVFDAILHEVNTQFAKNCALQQSE